MKKIIIILIVNILIGNSIYSQDRFKDIELQLNKLAKKDTALNSVVNISITNVTLHEFLRGLAVTNSVNLSVAPSLKNMIIINFNNVSVINVLVFISKKYNLDIKIIGSIISVDKYDSKLDNIRNKKDIIVKYDKSSKMLSVELQDDTLGLVTKKISRLTGNNILLSQGIENKKVSAYINKMPVESVIENICFANGLELEKTKDGYYLINEKEIQKSNKSNKGRYNKKSSGNNFIEAKSYNNISLSVTDMPISDLIREVSTDLKVNYFLLSKIEGSISIYAKNLNYETFLTSILQGLDYTFKKDKSIFIIGSLKSKLETTKVIDLQYRTVEKIVEFIPATYKTGVEIIEFHELNSLFLTGKSEKIEEIVTFLHKIDKPVPLISIEVIIIDVSENHNIQTGIDAGFGTPPTTSSGSLFPAVDVSLSTQSINGLINNFNGLGWVNLGKVTPQFYLSLKALEENGSLKIRSTPKLSTLNGHEAKLSSGETKYYKEESNNYYGSQNPQLATNSTWKAVNADLALTIKPIVSSDGQITLSVELNQSEFTPREFEDAPPGNVSRNFSSLVRVKDQELILLGGIEKNSSSNTTRGVPFLSRIPIIKHFFSQTTDSKTKSKLSIFIKPTIIN